MIQITDSCIRICRTQIGYLLFFLSGKHILGLTTIGITKGERGNGITKQFYRKLEKVVADQNKIKCISTRTWTTNKTHIKILQSLGYKLVLEIKNDRGPGIHTVYYAKDL